ncbi:hypothetical protein SAMN05660649_02461 [Desulfotomaculum arcticum]|uniref:Uncharacterized protein n=1 Tax=Desulfotruncus arcticus DSM 17038 TaxID=1121424 RepID=A0A1I2U6A2_9FIRM|nr:hypothetical protein [Desulfotruncus arcticus]SFG71207.1 hypothetical protein SAMN05660649_02461 [Desulfotomaculum arcticum] [Desulfotruncus arcticus DSM 17038]
MYLEQYVNKPDRENICWDFDLNSEFRGQRKIGFGFVVDVLDGAPKLALYHMKVNYSTSTTLDSQPPRDMLVRAVREQGGHLEEENLYPINQELKDWVRQRILS